MADGDIRFEVNGYDSYVIRLGEELRGERATLGKSLLNVQKDLRIKAAYISAIENCDLNAFPNKGFIAGYVRSYARYLNLNPEIIFERFCIESGYINSIHNKSVKLTKSPNRKKFGNSLVTTQLDWKPSGPTYEDKGKQLKRTIITYLTPFILVVALGFGITYGGWKILVDIQKLRIVPADNLPIILSEFKIDSTNLVKENDNQVHLNIVNAQEMTKLPKKKSPAGMKMPAVEYRDSPIADIRVEDAGMLGLNSLRLEKTSSFKPNNSSYSTSQYNDFVGLESASQSETPYANIKSIRYLEELQRNKENEKLNRVSSILDLSSNQIKDKGTASGGEVVNRLEYIKLNIFAVKPSWIRINNKGDKVVFEKILKSGEVLQIKRDWLNGNLRAGNAKDLFFSLDGITYGPVSDNRKVIKQFKIDPDYIFDTLKVNHLKDSFLNKYFSPRKSL